MREIAIEIDGAVVLVYHPSLSGMSTGSGMAGSTAWDAACRQRIYLSEPKREPDADVPTDDRLLTTKKANYARSGQQLLVTYRDGLFVPVHEPGGVVASIRRRNCDAVFLRLLGAVMGQGRFVSDSKHSGNFAPKRFANGPDNENYTSADFSRAMERLFTNGKIKVGTYGRKGDQHRQIVPFDGEE